MSKHRGTRAFTLIELLVVVVVMALIAAVLVPALISSIRSEELEGPSERIAQAPPTLVALGSNERHDDPRLIDTAVEVTLTAQPVLDGFRVQNRYRAAFRGTFVVENVDDAAHSIMLRFPFPPGTTEARGVSLSLLEGEALREPRGVRYLKDAIEWTGPARPREPLTLVITYEAVGRDAFTYDVAGQGRTDRIHLELALVNAPEVEVPADSLTPTKVGRDSIEWSLERAVASRPIIVELPAGASSLGKLIRLFQLAALGVLLFGAGFWYVSERSRPGRLDSFRWGHFLLLALNYSLFFLVFGVVVYGGSPGIALAVASLVSLPLLVLHVARVLDLRFALRSVLPLAIYSLAAVVGAVYLAPHRALVLLGVAVVGTAYLTATYRGFASAQIKHHSQRAAHRTRATVPPGFELEQTRVAAALERLEQAVAAEDRFAVTRAAHELNVLQAVLQNAVTRAQVEMAEAIAKLEVETEASVVVLGETRSTDPFTREAERALEESLASARALRREAASPAAPPKEVTARAIRLGSTLASRRTAATTALEALSRHGAHRGQHCSACGSASDPASSFCPDCGTPRPHAIDCGGCGATFRVPVQLAKKRWKAEALHCDRCGEGLSAIDRA